MADPKKGFLLRVPKPLFEELRRWAEQDMRSINGQIEWVLRDALKKRGRVADDDEDAREGGAATPDAERDDS